MDIASLTVAALQFNAFPIAFLQIGLYVCHSHIVLSFQPPPNNPQYHHHLRISSLKEVKSTTPDMFFGHSLGLDWLLLNAHSGSGFKLQGTEDSYNFV